MLVSGPERYSVRPVSVLVARLGGGEASSGQLPVRLPWLTQVGGDGSGDLERTVASVARLEVTGGDGRD